MGCCYTPVKIHKCNDIICSTISADIIQFVQIYRAERRTHSHHTYSVVKPWEQSNIRDNIFFATQLEQVLVTNKHSSKRRTLLHLSTIPHQKTRFQIGREMVHNTVPSIEYSNNTFHFGKNNFPQKVVPTVREQKCTQTPLLDQRQNSHRFLQRILQWHIPGEEPHRTPIISWMFSSERRQTLLFLP